MKQKIPLILMRVLQYIIAVILLTTAIGKLLDIQGFAHIIEAYGIIPGSITAPLGLAISLFELGLAIWLFSGKKLKFAALTSLGFHTGLSVWTATALIKGLELPNCGCFGVFWAKPLTWKTLASDLVLVTLSIVLYLLASNREKNKK